MPASMAATSSRDSGCVRSSPKTSPTNTGWICRMAMVIDAPSRLHAAHAPGRHRAREPLERERADVVGLDHTLDGRGGPRGDEDLAGARLAAEPRGQVGDRPDRSVVEAPLEADGADGG